MGPGSQAAPTAGAPQAVLTLPGWPAGPSWHCNSEAGGSFLLAREQYQGQPGDLPPTPSSFHCEPLLDPRPLGPLEKEMVTHSSNLAWRNPWTEESGRL